MRSFGQAAREYHRYMCCAGTIESNIEKFKTHIQELLMFIA